MDKWVAILSEKWKTVLATVVCLLFIAVGLLTKQFFELKKNEERSTLDVYEMLLADEPTEDESAEKGVLEDEQINEEVVEISPKEIKVDVKGAVKVPGVYKMSPDSRVIDAIEEAGGIVESAEQNAVNLAQVVEDQMVIYVPEKGEEGIEIASGNVLASAEENSKSNDSNKININNAEKSELMLLNGIGDSKADNIIAYRDEKGMFQSIEEIKNVSGIGEATFEKLKEYISVSP